MVRVTRGQVTVVAALLLLAAATLAIAYAAWTKQLFVQGTVNTGNVNAVWTWVPAPTRRALRTPRTSRRTLA
jgi:hypothetical protein